jgi:hypothetical protein
MIHMDIERGRILAETIDDARQRQIAVLEVTRKESRVELVIAVGPERQERGDDR